MRALCGAGAAPAQGLDLEDLDAVGEFDQALGAGEQLGPEVGRDAEGVDVEAEVVDDAGQLVDLVGREELRLVRDDVVHAAALGQLVDDVRVHVEVVGHLHGVGDEAEARGGFPRRPGRRA